MNSGASGETSRLAVLGLLKLGPNHGYGLRAILETWEIHRWLDVKYGSIYAALKRFTESGLVEVVSVDAAHGPTRTTYQLTPAGETELEELARRTWTDGPHFSLPIDLLVIFLSYDWIGHQILDRGEVAQLLKQRVEGLESAVANLRQSKKQFVTLTELGPLQSLQRLHFDHGIDLLNAELRWTRNLIDAFRRGDFNV